MSRQRVVVGMSGGVDSSVAAALLVEAGYDVVGVTMRLWTESRPEELPGRQQCCSVEDIDDARRAAGQIGIRHYVMNFEEEFRATVVDNFVAEYAAGRTPNPCVRCNEHIKYRALLDRLPALDADYIATGHYARVVHADPAFGRHRLLRATDLSKDQSYVLCMLQQGQLARLLLPVGWYSKADVRKEAARLGLEVAEKPDSVEICFVPGNDYRAFVEPRVAATSGELVDGAGAVVGEHRGITAYTIGQRKGLGAFGEPRYVTAIDATRNVVTIGPEEDLFTRDVTFEAARWVGGLAPQQGARVFAKARYKADPASASIISMAGERVELRFDKRQRAITPGQTIALYEGEDVIGGGTVA
ncbi:MAG: tRNA 2-thiouridine(34) synthase MnmA [Dehalococcoidia bacterium]